MGLFPDGGESFLTTPAATPPLFLIGVNEDGTFNGDPTVLNAPGQTFAATKRGGVLQLFGSAQGLFLDDQDEKSALELTPPASGSPRYYTEILPEIRIGGVPAKVHFSGLAPGQKGLWQINVLVVPSFGSGLRNTHIFVGNRTDSKSILLPDWQPFGSC